jgi:hypothetical protein
MPKKWEKGHIVLLKNNHVVSLYIYINEHDLTWFLACCFMILSKVIIKNKCIIDLGGTYILDKPSIQKNMGQHNNEKFNHILRN